MEQLSQFAILVRNAVFGYLNGLHNSRKLGGTGDFIQYRPYVPGDDLRHTDWKLFARHDKLFQKISQEDSSTKVAIVLDSSPSMHYPRDEEGLSAPFSKYAYASLLAASLFQIAKQQNDEPAILTASGGFIPSSTPPASVLDALSALSQKRQAEASFSSEVIFHALRYLNGTHGIVILLSDFIDVPLERTLKLLNANRLSVYLSHVIHPDELELPFPSSVNFKDAESEETITTTPDAFRENYIRKMTLFLEQTKKTALSLNAVYAQSKTSSPLLNSLADLLVR